MHAYCKAHGLGLIPWGSLNGGDLARPFSDSTLRKETNKHKVFSDADKTIISRVEEIAKKRGGSMAQIALAWLLQKDSKFRS